jgi:hypothetical protein
MKPAGGVGSSAPIPPAGVTPLSCEQRAPESFSARLDNLHGRIEELVRELVTRSGAAAHAESSAVAGAVPGNSHEVGTVALDVDLPAEQVEPHEQSRFSVLTAGHELLLARVLS